MIVLRKEQMEALSRYLHRDFLYHMLIILRGRFAVEYEMLGEEKILRVVDLGIARATAHGFSRRGDVCDYIVLMFILGSYFDEDPLVPWAADILKRTEAATSSSVLKDLYSQAKRYVGRTAGPNGEYYKRTLLRERNRSFASFAEIQTKDLGQDIRSFLRGIYPRRYNVTPESAFANFIDLGMSAAHRYGLGELVGTLVYMCLMFMLGSHFDRDPLHPWIGPILQDDSVTDPTYKARKVYEAALDRLEQYIAIDRSFKGA